MKQDNIYQDALPRLAEGVRKAASIVSKTMGPKGTNVELESSLYPYHLITNDGATIIKEIQLADPLEKIGLSHLKEAADRSNNNSGDGSTTMTVLLNAILEEGIKSGVSTLEIKQSLDECLPIIEASIKEQTRQITVEDIPAVARIAGENEELATTLGAIYKSIGKDGIIHLEGSGTYDSSYSLIEGVRFIDTGYLSPYMAHDDKTKAIYKNPTILVTKNKIQHINDINPLLKALEAQNKKDFVIFTDDMDSGVARTLIEAHKSGILNILIIKAPTLWKGYVFEDFAKITGATIIEDASGTKLGKDLKLSWLGTCKTLIVDKEETTVIGIQDISEHIAALAQEGSNDSKLRLSWLTTKTAILKLGAKSETELSYLRLKAEDAIHSSRLALKSGIVAGGGLALFNASHLMPDSIGGNLLKEALISPMKQIMTNAGKGLDRIITMGHYEYGTNKKFIEGKDTLDGIGNTIGFDASSGKNVDMFDANIVDASAIVLGAIRNALGIASTLLTTSSVIILPPKSTEEMMNNAMMRPMQGM